MTQIDHLNPAGMHCNPAFSQAVVVSGPHRTLYIGGQNAVDGSGNIVGVGDIAAQAAQVALNLQTVLAAADAGIDDVVKWNIHIVQGQPIGPAMQAFQQQLGRPTRPPAIRVLFVPGLAHGDFLLEVDAIAVSPARSDQ
jgi:enamine deaminase RidA (YjgF/YER057c/UK114 family)